MVGSRRRDHVRAPRMRGDRSRLLVRYHGSRDRLGRVPGGRGVGGEPRVVHLRRSPNGAGGTGARREVGGASGRSVAGAPSALSIPREMVRRLGHGITVVSARLVMMAFGGGRVRGPLCLALAGASRRDVGGSSMAQGGVGRRISYFFCRIARRRALILRSIRSSSRSEASTVSAASRAVPGVVRSQLGCFRRALRSSKIGGTNSAGAAVVSVGRLGGSFGLGVGARCGSRGSSCVFRITMREPSDGNEFISTHMAEFGGGRFRFGPGNREGSTSGANRPGWGAPGGTGRSPIGARKVRGHRPPREALHRIASGPCAGPAISRRRGPPRPGRSTGTRPRPGAAAGGENRNPRRRRSDGRRRGPRSAATYVPPNRSAGSPPRTPAGSRRRTPSRGMPA